MSSRPSRGRYLALAAAAGAFVLLARSRCLRWGAADREVGSPLPGDDLIPNPDLTATRAISIEAGSDRVWPWIAQLGQGRGGFYSYDFLENLIGCDIHSADRIVPEWQQVRVGDQVRLAPRGPVRLEVAALQPGRWLVLRGDPTSGSPPPYDFTWSFVLREQANGSTRLLVRERYGYRSPWARLLVEPVEAISFLMSSKMLRGIRNRAESMTGTPSGSAR
ncbi:MAG: SRPBCC family protein [Candidatus Dormibacteraeota bacterium]|nr:SRPBCC family protein [Candidatus Dormibacteraeota bacterium]